MQILSTHCCQCIQVCEPQYFVTLYQVFLISWLGKQVGGSEMRCVLHVPPGHPFDEARQF